MTFLDRYRLLTSSACIKAFRRRAPHVLLLALPLLLFGCRKEDPGTNWPAAANVATEISKNLEVVDLAGRSVDPFAASGAKAMVFIFVATECPISNRYAPEIRKLDEKFARSGVRLWLVYTDPETSPAMIREHLKAYNLPSQALRDPKHDLVRLSHVHVTPEVAVFVPGPRLSYNGRIDDRYADLSKDRLEATQHDLERAVEAIVHGEPVPEVTTRAIGCYISDVK